MLQPGPGDSFGDSFGDGGSEGDRLEPHWQRSRLDGKFAHIKLSQLRCTKSHADTLDSRLSGSLRSLGLMREGAAWAVLAGMGTGSLEDDQTRSGPHRQPGIWSNLGLL